MPSCRSPTCHVGAFESLSLIVRSQWQEGQGSDAGPCKAILLQRNLTAYRRLPANLRGALADIMTPLGRDNQGYASRRDKTGGETGEIVAGGVAS